MKNSLKKTALLTVIAALIFNFTVLAKVSSQASSYISVRDYIKNIVETTKLSVDQTKEEPYITAAISAGLVTEGEFTNYNSNIINEDAAVLANRADELLHGSAYNEKLYHDIEDKKRISDLNKVSKEKQDEVIKVFQKGIMIGSSNGAYTHDRTFKGKTKLKSSDVAGILKRVKIKSSRYNISPDGQVIRTTKLPKNYKSYDYILASFPNSFYEEKFVYQTRKGGGTPANLEDYASPKDLKKMTMNIYDNEYKLSDILEKYQDKWCEKVEKNLSYRLNVNYKTIDDKWIKGLRNTYPIFNDESMDSDYKKVISNYVSRAKKNKIIIKSSQISVEPSTMYYCSGMGYMVRCYVKFKVTSANKFYSFSSGDQDLMIYGTDVYLDGLKKNSWYEATFDVGLTGNSMTDIGNGYAVTTDWLYR